MKEVRVFKDFNPSNDVGMLKVLEKYQFLSSRRPDSTHFLWQSFGWHITILRIPDHDGTFGPHHKVF
jgi:hypothetical protein